jgi:hypothetical protein
MLYLCPGNMPFLYLALSWQTFGGVTQLFYQASFNLCLVQNIYVHAVMSLQAHFTTWSVMIFATWYTVRVVCVCNLMFVTYLHACAVLVVMIVGREFAVKKYLQILLKFKIY